MVSEELEGWEEKGRKAQEGWYIYVYITMTDLHCCMAEINTRM